MNSSFLAKRSASLTNSPGKSCVTYHKGWKTPSPFNVPYRTNCAKSLSQPLHQSPCFYFSLYLHTSYSLHNRGFLFQAQVRSYQFSGQNSPRASHAPPWSQAWNHLTLHFSYPSPLPSAPIPRCLLPHLAA